MGKGRRGAGEGSIYRRASDGRWIGSVQVGYEGSKRVRKTVSGRTRFEVSEKLKVLLRQRDTGAYAALDPQSVEWFLADWLRSAVRPHRSPKTYAQYEMVARLYLVPHLGTVRLSALTGQQIQAFVATLMQERGANTARYAGRVLCNALNRAVRWGILPRNPMATVDLPTVRHRETGVWTPEEARAFFTACPGHALGPLFQVLLVLALRKGEGCGLRWGDISADCSTVTVRAQLQYVEGRLVRRATKTNRTRTLHIPRLARSAFVRPAAARNEDYVFTNARGHPYAPQNLHFPFLAICEEAGLPRITIHGLRHTTATALLLRGVPVHVVSRFLGHSSVTMTLNTYAHVLATSQQDVAGEVDVLYG